MDALLLPRAGRPAVLADALPEELSTLLEAAARGLLDYAGCAKTALQVSITDHAHPGELLVITLHRSSVGPT